MIAGMSDHESVSLHFSAVVYSPVPMRETSSDLERDLEVQGTWSSRTLLSSSSSLSTADFFSPMFVFPHSSLHLPCTFGNKGKQHGRQAG